MSFGARALAIGVAVLVMLGSAHAQDETIQKMVGLWQGKVDVHDEPERTLVIKSVRARAWSMDRDHRLRADGKELELPAGEDRAAA